MFTASFIENESHLFEKKVKDATAILAQEFKKTTRFYILFHLFFAAVGTGLLFSFILFLSFWIHSPMLAFLIAAVLLGCFSYLVLLSYFQTKKKEQLLLLSQTFVEECRNYTAAENHLSIAHGIYRAVFHLDKIEQEYYVLPFALDTLNGLLKKFGLYCHWKDVLKMKELLLFAAIKEHVGLIKKEPTDLEAHAALAEGYLKLASLYQEKKVAEEEMGWVSPEYASEAMQKKFKVASGRAVEEFKIIETYVPGDLWVHAQLAHIYHDLQEAELEIAEYETMLQIAPQDQSVMSYLGMLYFQQGKIAKGLRIYEQLKNLGNERCGELLAYYDAYDALEGSTGLTSSL